MDAGSLVVGFLAGGVIAWLAGYARGHIDGHTAATNYALERPGPSQATWEPHELPGHEPLVKPIDFDIHALFRERAEAARQAAEQQEASNQRSDEAMGGLGNVPSNVVSKEGDARVTLRNDVELGSWNDPKPAPASPADPTELVHRSWLKPATNHGDAISSLMKAEGLTFPEAVERLAKP